VGDRTTEEPPYEGGSQPVQERPTEVPAAGRSAAQTIIIALAVLAILAAALWLVVPFAG
jgi:hypothetical protein